MPMTTQESKPFYVKLLAGLAAIAGVNGAFGKDVFASNTTAAVNTTSRDSSGETPCYPVNWPKQEGPAVPEICFKTKAAAYAYAVERKWGVDGAKAFTEVDKPVVSGVNGTNTTVVEEPVTQGADGPVNHTVSNNEVGSHTANVVEARIAAAAAAAAPLPSNVAVGGVRRR